MPRGLTIDFTADAKKMTVALLKAEIAVLRLKLDALEHDLAKREADEGGAG